MGMRAWQKSSKPYASGPHVLFRITFDTQSREWFIQPEVMQEENPHVIEVLCRWGFIGRVHDRSKQAKAPEPVGIPSLSTEQHPVPGKYHLQVEPMLALLLFVFANRAHQRDLDLSAPKRLSVHEEGRTDAIKFTCDRVLHLGPHEGPRLEVTTRQEFSKPTSTTRSSGSRSR